MEVNYRGKSVRVATGGRDHDPELPGIVLIHGAGMDRTSWQLQSRWLAHHGYRVAAVDLPGHGLSEGPPLASIVEMADWTAGLIDELELGPAHVVGFSLGTFVALELAVRHPDAARSLVLIGTSTAMPVHPELLEASRSDIRRASRLITSWGIGSRAHRGGHQSPGMWLIGGSTALVDRSPEGALAADMEACNAYDGAVAAASKVSVPVTFVLGKEDKMTPMKTSGDLLDSVENKRVVALDAIGHMMPIEDPIGARKAIAEAIAWADSQ